jgi:Cu(I)/Ag(I) efflux system membrane fusion protein
MTGKRSAHWLPFAFLGLVVLLAVVYRAPLSAWFRGSSAVEAKSSAAPASEPHAEGDVDHYTCSMHPSVKQPGPGKCPICGMDLIPVTREQQSAGVVLIDEHRRQLIGVRTAPVAEGPLRRSFRALGRVTYDESKLTDVTLKVRGFITRLLVNETGQHVARGQTLLTLYSPDLYSAEQDFLLASRGATAAAGAVAGEAPRAPSFARAARKRLNLLGLSDAQIDAILNRGEPEENTAIASPAAGFVIEKDVVEGAAVEPGMRLLRIAALDRVWVEADVYEADLARVRVGQPARVTLDYLPGKSYDAKVAFVYPYLESGARTGRVRIELPNKSGELRPGMYASVELASDVGPRLEVPAAAVVYTGPRRLVFVDLGEGRFSPREIQVGSEADGRYEVLSGLTAGEVVATSGVFLIAAEARISTAAKYWDSAPEVPAPEPASTPSSAPPASSAMPIRRPAPVATMRAALPSAPAVPRAPAAVFSCPMHPAVRQATPGKCPICGMDLQLTPSGTVP